MADFIYFEADASDESSDEGEQMEVDNALIDNSQDQDLPAEHLEANNYIDDEYLESIGNESIDDFENFEEKRDLFLRSLKNPIENQTRENSFYLTLLYAIRF